MRQIENSIGGRITIGEEHLAYRLARRMGAALHRPRAWLNEQLTLARKGFATGDADGLSQAFARRFLSCGCPPARGLHQLHVPPCRQASVASISDARKAAG